MNSISFGTALRRILERRGSGAGDLAARVGVPPAQFQSLLDGAPPSAPQLDSLAEALDWHVEDLLVLAQIPVPDHLFPVDPDCQLHVDYLVRVAVCLDDAARAELRDYIVSLPREFPALPVERCDSFKSDDPRLPAQLIRMFQNRNLDLYSTAVILSLMTPLYVAGSTIGHIGIGRKDLTPEIVSCFATVLGIPHTDLAAIAGMGLPVPEPQESAMLNDVSQFLWDVRRLTADQVSAIRDRALSLFMASR